MSVIGIAREISALLETKLTFPKLKNKYQINVYKNFDLCGLKLFQKIVFIQLLILTLSMAKNYLHNGSKIV